MYVGYDHTVNLLVQYAHPAIMKIAQAIQPREFIVGIVVKNIHNSLPLALYFMLIFEFFKHVLSNKR